MPVGLLQLPVGPELFILLLFALVLFAIPLAVGVVVLVSLRRRSDEEPDTADRVAALERRVDDLEDE